MAADSKLELVVEVHVDKARKRSGGSRRAPRTPATRSPALPGRIKGRGIIGIQEEKVP
jgi:hypothetical protein